MATTKKDNKMDEIRKSLPKGVVESGIFTDNDLRVLHVLSRMQERDYSDFYKEHGYFYAANENLKKEAELSSNSTLKNSLDRLEKYGLISRTPGDWSEPTHYVYHADAANNFTMDKKVKKTKSKDTRCEKLTHPETQTVTVQVGDGQHSDEKSRPILKINDLQEIITKAVEAGCAPLVKQIEAGFATLSKQIEELNANLLKMSISQRSERDGQVLETDGQHFDGEKKGGNAGNKSNSLRMRDSQGFDGENEPNSLRMRGGQVLGTDGQNSENLTQDIDLDIYNIYHDDHVSRGQDPGEETSYGGEEKKKKIEKTKKEEIEGLRRSIAFCDEAMKEAAASGDRDRYREILDERSSLGAQLAELEPEDEYDKLTDAEIEKKVRDHLSNGGDIFDLPTTVKNRWWQIHP